MNLRWCCVKTALTTKLTWWCCVETASTMKLTCLITQREFSLSRLGDRLRSFPTSNPRQTGPKANPRGKAAVRSGMTLATAKVSDSPLSEEILECEFPKKFSTPTFDYCCGASDPVQHIRHFRDKMLVHYPLICLTFSSSLKGVSSDSFYSLLPCLLHSFEERTVVFLTQYASRREAKNNNHHLISIKMRQGDNLMSYIDYFQNQLTMILNCGEDVSTLVFIIGLQISTSIQTFVET